MFFVNRIKYKSVVDFKVMKFYQYIDNFKLKSPDILIQFKFAFTVQVLNDITI